MIVEERVDSASMLPSRGSLPHLNCYSARYCVRRATNEESDEFGD
jgi:hypothetical protein